jgi:2-polyprenyl-3-methyl-5-hydroxy-6-metoxy-1,4-benzoquinol methylase
MLVPELDEATHCCPFCGSTNLKRIRPFASDTTATNRIFVVECTQCAFAWQHPTSRSDSQSVAAFEHLYRDQGRTASTYFDPAQKRAIAELELAFVTSLPIEGKSMMDIGAGNGEFAYQAASAGWSILAVDPALDPSQHLSTDGLTLIKGTTNDVDVNLRFEVVTLWDVIEHAAKPVELIAIAKKFLKPGGWLVIETGNYKSADRISGGLNHWIYQLDHRWYFSPDSIREVLSRFGFGEFVVAEHVLRPQWKGTKIYPGPSIRSLLRALITTPTSAAKHLATYTELRNARSWDAAGLGIFTVAARLPIFE